MIAFLVENWHILIGLISAPISIIIGYIFGGKQKQKVDLKKDEALLKQEDVKAKRDMADLESEIYTRLTERLDNELVLRDKEVEELKFIQKDLITTIKIQEGNIKSLQKTVDDYKRICGNCQVRIEKEKTKK